MNQVALQVSERYVRMATFVLFASTLFGIVGNVSARSHRFKNQPVIRVRIYNYAGITRLDLRNAEGRSTYLFAGAGIRIAWAVQTQIPGAGPPQPEDSLADFFVRIVPAFMAAGYRHDPGALGQSLVPSGVHGPTPGGFANIFWDRVKDLSSNSGLSCSEVLGDAMAHELGHLLMGSGHSAWGIMRAHWKLQELKPDNVAGLRFLPAQVTLLQQGARSLHKHPSLSVTAQR